MILHNCIYRVIIEYFEKNCTYANMIERKCTGKYRRHNGENTATAINVGRSVTQVECATGRSASRQKLRRTRNGVDERERRQEVEHARFRVPV